MALIGRNPNGGTGGWKNGYKGRIVLYPIDLQNGACLWSGSRTTGAQGPARSQNLDLVCLLVDASTMGEKIEGVELPEPRRR